MIKIQAQYDGKAYHPYSDQDRDLAATYKKNQLVTMSVTGTSKPHRVKQLNTFWKVCEIFAENTDNENFDHKEKVCFQLKVALNFIDASKTMVDIHGKVHLHYLSISFKNLKQIERTKFIDRAYSQLSEWSGVPVETLVEEAKKRCKRVRV